MVLRAESNDYSHIKQDNYSKSKKLKINDFIPVHIDDYPNSNNIASNVFFWFVSVWYKLQQAILLIHTEKNS